LLNESFYCIEEWKKIFRNRGIDVAHIKSLPANSHHLSRKDEIVNWFSSNNVTEDFVLIDDDKSLNDLPNFLKGN
ncbi:MAG TPA: hypothetical protein VEY06_05940, partial [Flavisolibacter sp.]|nr:hypothetical protein [Flavisolibacter sp.]